jgi:hypothetical protein
MPMENGSFKNEFAAGGAVKYDPSAVDRIINQLREVNRG